MKAISVRNISDEAYDAIKEMAARNHRSMQEQIKRLIEREARLARASAVSRALAWRSTLAGRNLGDTVGEVREDRAR